MFTMNKRRERIKYESANQKSELAGPTSLYEDEIFFFYTFHLRHITAVCTYSLRK